MKRHFFLILVVGLLLTVGPSWAQETKLPDFGFRGLEIFKLERRSQSMVPGDFNSDGLRDLVLIDNSHSRLDLMLQRAERPDVQEALDANDVNAIRYDWRFQHEKIPVNKEVSALAAGDFNHDGKDDIAYFGVPDRLIVMTQAQDNEWPELLNIRLADVPNAAWLIAAGDLNHDDRDDLVVLGKTQTYLLYQNEQGSFDAPETLMNTSSNLGLAQIADLDGDGLQDLCYTADERNERTLCLRIQTADGRLGPELVFDLHKPRSVTLGDFDGQAGKELFVVDSRTNRVNVLRLEHAEKKPGESQSRLIQYGLGDSGTGRDRELAAGDIDGDGQTDVVITDPEAARLLVFRQRKRQGLDSGTIYPALVGATQVRIAPFGDGPATVLVLSSREKTLGASHFQDGRLTFPKALPVEGEPLAFEVADLDGDATGEVLYLSEVPGQRNYRMAALKWTSKGWKPFEFGTEKPLFFSLSSEPERLKKLDANRDGKPDYLVFYGGGRTPSLLVTDKDGVPQLVETEGGIQLGDVSRESVFISPIAKKKANDKADGALLAARDAFARNLRLDASNHWQVLDQYNASEPNARIAGVAAIDWDGEPGDEIVLIDTGIQKLRVLRQEDGVYRRFQEIDLGLFPFLSSHVADLNSDGREDLLVFGRNKFGVVYAGTRDPVLKTIANYETKIDNVYFADVAVGDLNGDQKTDLAVIDTRQHYIEILKQAADNKLIHAMQFKVFEEKSFSRSGAPGNEPRETLILDVTGDNRADLILLIHDRILLYPQDTGND